MLEGFPVAVLPAAVDKLPKDSELVMRTACAFPYLVLALPALGCRASSPRSAKRFNRLLGTVGMSLASAREWNHGVHADFKRSQPVWLP
eukprot:4513547-Amphidinium_carterae.1